MNFANYTAQKAPALNIDKMMAERHGHVVGPRQAIERAVVWNLIQYMAANGWRVSAVNDGDAWEKTATPLEVMELVFNLDEAWLRFRKDDAKHSAYIVLGNDGYDALSDWNYSDDDADGFNAALSQFDGEKLAHKLLRA